MSFMPQQHNETICEVLGVDDSRSEVSEEMQWFMGLLSEIIQPNGTQRHQVFHTEQGFTIHAFTFTEDEHHEIIRGSNV